MNTVFESSQIKSVDDLYFALLGGKKVIKSLMDKHYEGPEKGEEIIKKIDELRELVGDF